VNIWEFDWTGDGPVVAVVSTGPAESAWYDANLAVLDIGELRAVVVRDSAWQLQSPAVSPDGRQVAFVEGLASDRGHVAATVTLLDLDTGDVSTVGEMDAVAVRWLESNRLFYVGPRGLETACGIMTRDGEVEKEWSGPVTLGQCHRWGVACNADGRLLAAALEAPNQPPELAVMDMSAADPQWTPLTPVNLSLSGRCTSAVKRCTWCSDGTEIEGLLVLPALATSDRLPLVVVVHGGPTNAWSYGFSHGYLHTGLLLAENGYAVLLPNPRGSAGRGSLFARMNIGDLGGCDLRDIVAGVTSLVEEGVVEPNRIGITGMSYGGYMSAWAPTQTRLFAASVTMATHTDWISFHYTANIARFDELFLACDPRDPHGRHFHRSPVIHARECASPMLILHGALDLCCPVGQAHEMYNALVEAGCETELVVYQRGGHSWAEDAYLVDTWQRTKSWFDRHLNGG
jgi:dipeptidyl aminopeptidase/acylaminoacyl peptidase